MPAEPRDRKGCGTGVTISRGNKRGAKVSTAAMHGGCGNFRPFDLLY